MTVPDFLFTRKHLRASLAAAVIFALVVRGFIPVGYMPDFNRLADQPAITICNGMGPMDMAGMPMPADPATPKHDDSQKFQDHAPCPFSVNAVFAAADNIPQFAEPFIAFVILNVLAAFALARSRCYGNSAARAPPAFS